MEFTLFYNGNLKANGNARHKQEIRRHFHSQLKNLWKQIPLDSYSEKWLNLKGEGGAESIITSVGKFKFAPLVNEGYHLIAELNIMLLRPEPPGSIITQGGDIDNRLKTLFDALRMPKINEIPSGDAPKDEEIPFHCLLEDDNLITKVSVKTDRLLDASQYPSDIILTIHVTTRNVLTTYGNIGF